MRKKYWFFVLALVATVFAVEYDLTKRTSHVTAARLSDPSQKNTAKYNTNKLSQSENTPAKNFTQKFSEVSAEISNLQQNPNAAEERIQSLAADLTNQDLNQLSEVMTNKNSLGDQRAMAVEILSRSRSVSAIKKLEDFIKDHDESAKWSRSREFESVLRAQAIEGIAAFPEKDLAISSLTSLDQKISESFLKDRIRRSVASLKNKAPSVEKQDEAALSKLVE